MRVSGGYIIVPSSLQVALPERPKDLGIDGPVISASRMAVLRPDWRALTARSEVTSDFPTPPLPLTTAITSPYFSVFPVQRCAESLWQLPDLLHRGERTHAKEDRADEH